MGLYLEVRPELLQAVKTLSEKHDLALYRKVLREQDRANMNSLLTEARFGIFFDLYAQALRHEVKAFKGSNKTPDWAIDVNGQIIIAEVYRLNPAEDLQRRREAVGVFHRIIPQPLKLSGEFGVLTKKAEKYGPLVEAAGYPLLICLYFDFVSGQDKLDLFNCLYGRSVEFGGPIAHPDFPLGTVYHNLESALFYDQQQIRKNVSGVLLKTEDSFIYFDNYNPANRLNSANRIWLKSFELDYNDF